MSAIALRLPIVTSWETPLITGVSPLAFWEEWGKVRRPSDGRCGRLPDMEVFVLLRDMNCEQSQHYSRSAAEL